MDLITLMDPQISGVDTLQSLRVYVWVSRRRRRGDGGVWGRVSLNWLLSSKTVGLGSVLRQ